MQAHINATAYRLGPYKPSSPATKGLHGLVKGSGQPRSLFSHFLATENSICPLVSLSFSDKFDFLKARSHRALSDPFVNENIFSSK